jgi:hypothetical protein
LREEDVVLIVLAVLTLFVLGGLAVLWMAMANRRAWREMEHQERLAMIQRGLVPAPEADPLGFDAATSGSIKTPDRRSERWRTAGITFIGVGLALMMLLSITAGEAAVGIGIGGAFCVLGAALLVNSSQLGRTANRQRPFSISGPPRPSTPAEPPSNLAP